MVYKTNAGKKDQQEKSFHDFLLSQRNPESNIYRQFKKVPDIKYVRDM
jgi:hypothetical protein